ncbi:MAG TPA: type II secretion system protein GspM [Rhizobium sp.]|nr:type II secretion system protein GspM [Rhizobium sp.]
MLDRSIQRLLNASARTRLVVALVAVGAVLAAILLMIVGAIQGIRQSYDTLDETRRRIGVYRATISAADKLGNVEPASALDDMFFAGTSDATVKANVQAWLQDQATALTVEVNSVSDLPNRALEQASLVGLKVNLYGPFESVQSLLLKIEANNPPVFIVKAVISSAATPGTDSTLETNVNASLDLYAGSRSTTAGSP